MYRHRNKRRLSIALRLFLTTIPVLAIGFFNVQPASAGPICGILPDPLSRGICHHIPGGNINIPGLPNLGNINIPGIPTVSSIIKDDIVKPILSQITQEEAKGVGYVLNKQFDYINSHTQPVLSRKWFLNEYAVLLGMGVFVAMFLFAGRLTAGVKNQDGADMGKAVLSLAVFLGAGGLIPAIVQALVSVIDGSITQGWLDLAGKTVKTDLSHMVSALNKNNSFGSAVVLPLIFLAVGVLGGIITILELFFRMGGIYVFTAAEAIGLALLVGGRLSAEGFKRITWGLVGLLLMKPVMAVLLTMSVQLLGDNGNGGADPIVLGSVMCLSVPFLSWGAYKWIARHNIQPVQGAARVAIFLRNAALAVGLVG